MWNLFETNSFGKKVNFNAFVDELYWIFEGDDNGWEILDRDRRWSDPIDTSLTHEHFVAIPGYGDATIHIEQVIVMYFVCFKRN